MNCQHSGSPLGSIAPTCLDEARRQLHWAVQILGAVGDEVVEKRADDGHSNLEWLAERALFAGRPSAAAPHCRAALRPVDLSLIVLDQAAQCEVDALSLAGRAVEDGLAWMSEALERQGLVLEQPLRVRDYDLPIHGVAEGESFAITSRSGLEEASSWFMLGDRVLREIARVDGRASEVRCWPHHFDLATLLTVERDADGSATRTLGIGALLGDEVIPQPYFYVSPWPRPDAEPATPLEGGGRWHGQGYFAAVLELSELRGQATLVDQQRQIEAFVGSAQRALAPVG